MFLFPDSQATITCDNGENHCYQDLLLLAEEVESLIPQRSLVLCLMANDFGSLLGYITFAYGKHVPMLLSVETDPQRIHNILELYQPEYLWIPEELLKDYSDCAVLMQTHSYALVKTSYHSELKIHPDLCLLASTSGSTGSPNFVRQSYNNIKFNTQSIVEYLGIDSTDSAVTSLPIHYTFGMSIINCQIAAGATLVLTDKSFVQKEFWSLLKQEQISIISGVPYTYEMLDRLRVFRKDLPHVKKMLQAGGKLSEALQQKIATYAKDYHKELFIMYGQTEATTRMSYLPADKAIDKIASIGIPIPGGKLQIIDTEGQVISEPGQVGELVYYGQNVCLGYAQTRADLSLADEWQGKLLTGDLALFDKDQYYYIKGRKKRIIKHYGLRINLDELEDILKSRFPDRRIACVDLDESVIVFSEQSLDKNQALQYLTETTQLKRTAIQFKSLHQLPVLSNGKVDYQSLKKTI